MGYMFASQKKKIDLVVGKLGAFLVWRVFRHLVRQNNLTFVQLEFVVMFNVWSGEGLPSGCWTSFVFCTWSQAAGAVGSARSVRSAHSVDKWTLDLMYVCCTE